MAEKKKWEDMSKAEKVGGLIGLAVVVIIVIAIISAALGGGKKNNTATTDNTNNTASKNTASTAKSDTAQKSSTTTSNKTPATTKPATTSSTPSRQVKGTATTLGAGTFTGGTDVKASLYDVTAGSGQSGNFIINDGNSYNEVLGDGGDGLSVSKIRVQINNGDKIQISSLSSVTFTPVTAPYVTSHSAATLYAGTFIVGQDVGAGRYVVTPGSGQSGNFIVNDGSSYNEVLGSDSSMGQTPNVTVSLSSGDKITISGMDQVTLTPQ